MAVAVGAGMVVGTAAGMVVGVGTAVGGMVAGGTAVTGIVVVGGQVMVGDGGVGAVGIPIGPGVYTRMVTTPAATMIRRAVILLGPAMKPQPFNPDSLTSGFIMVRSMARSVLERKAL